MTKLQIIYCISQLLHVLNLTMLFMWLIIDHPVLRSPQQWFILQLFCLNLESWCKHSVYSKKKKKRWIFFSCGSHVKPQVFFKIKFFFCISNYGSFRGLYFPTSNEVFTLVSMQQHLLVQMSFEVTVMLFVS